MSGLTEQGFEIKRYADILSDQRLKAQEMFGVGVDVSVNSILGQVVQLSALELATLWEELQNVHDAFNPNAAQGKSLDDLCSLVGVYRESESKTNGYIEFTGSNGIVVPSGTQVSNPDTRDAFVTTEELIISSDKAYAISYDITSVESTTSYNIVINNTTVTFVTDADATVTELRDGLVLEIQNDVTLTEVTAVSVGSSEFTLTHNTAGNSIYVSPSASNISPTAVTSLGFVEAVETGAINATSGSITTIDTPVLDLSGVNNLTSLSVGRSNETDDELRIRRALFSSSSGKATPEAISRLVETVQGVSDAITVENRTFVTDADGRPPKSYEVIVFGGENSAIAQAIWDSGPAGIESYGLISENITDVNGDLKQVSFSRPVPKYITFEVDYTLYDEEQFPSNGAEGIREAIMEYSENFNTILGKDVIPQRYFGDIYRGISGIETLEIRVGVSDTEGGVPASITTTPVSIESREIPQFSLTRITVTQV